MASRRRSRSGRLRRRRLLSADARIWIRQAGGSVSEELRSRLLERDGRPLQRRLVLGTLLVGVRLVVDWGGVEDGKGRILDPLEEARSGSDGRVGELVNEAVEIGA